MSENIDSSQIEATDRAEEEAKELGVNLENVTGTGQEGRITVADVERAAAEGSAKLVKLDPAFGVGEYVVGDLSIPSGANPTPVSDGQYEALKDGEGNLAYPVIEEKEEK